MKTKISLAINIIIVVLTIFAAVIMFTGIKFMEGGYHVESTKLGLLRLFTVQSNLFMGIVAAIFAFKEIRILKGKEKEISTKMYVIKLMSTTAVGLTFLTVFGYLGIIVPGGVIELLKNSNLFFHLLIPVLSMINFAIFERTNKLKFRYTLFGLIPTIVYGIFYATNVLIHMENGKVSPTYDWYWFVQGGIWQMAIVVPLMLAVTYVISLILWRINRKKS